MEYIPLIYFTTLFVVIFKNRGFDASAYIALLYMVSSFFSVILVSQKYTSVDSRYITLTPTLVYCALITVLIAPIYKFNTKKIVLSTIRSEKFVNGLTYFYFSVFVLLVIFYFQDILRCFVLSDLKEAKELIHLEGLHLTRYPIYIEAFLYIARMFSPFSLVLLFVFFYSFASGNRAKKINILILLGSLSGIVIGILNLDRSKVLYWVLMFGLCAVLFWDVLDKNRKKSIKYYLVVILSLLVAYFAIVTIGRWGDSYGGTSHSLLSYAGQSYLNFCYFFNKFDNIDGVTLKYLLPAFHHFILGDYDGSIALQATMTERTGIYTGVFYSLLGDFIVSDGKAGLVIYPFVYTIVSLVAFKKHGKYYSFESYFVAFLVMIIPTVGIIAYYYANFAITVPLLLLLLLLKLLRRKRKLYK